MIKKIFIVTILALSVLNVLSQSTDKQTFTLDQFIDLVLKNNPGLKGYKMETDISDKLVSIQKSKLLPSLSISSGYMVSNQYSELVDYQTTNAGIEVYLPIWQNGKIRTEIEKSKLGYEASFAGFKIEQSNLVDLVSQTYIDYLRLNKLSGLAAEMANRLSITVDAAKDRLKIGLSKRSDMLKAQTEYSNAIYLEIQLETSKNKALRNLLRISGLPLDTSIIITGSLIDSIQWFEGVSPDSLFNMANQYLPEFQLINKQIKEQELSVVIEQKKMYPEIGAFGNYNYLKSPVYNSNLYGSAGLTLKMDIFTGWRKRNQVALEKIKTEQLNFQYNETSRLIYSEIQLAMLDLSEAREKINNAIIQMESSNESLQTINQQYLDGVSSMLELIDAQNSDFRANQNYINALADFDLAITLLKRKTGLLAKEYCK